MLDAYIIDDLERLRREEEQRRDDARPRVYVPLPLPLERKSEIGQTPDIGVIEKNIYEDDDSDGWRKNNGVWEIQLYGLERKL